MTKATQITYHTLTSILGSSAQYYDSKNATLQSAISIFGECSQEHISVAKAWNAVNVAAGNPCPNASIDNLVNENDILLYPNPTNTVLNIEVSRKLDENVKVYDLSGKIVKTFEVTNTHHSTDLSRLDKGVYMIRFVINGQTLVKRISVQ